jgi:hypothetical protein
MTYRSLPQRVLDRVAAGDRAPHHTDRVVELARLAVEGDEHDFSAFLAEINMELDKIFPEEENE